MKVAFALLAAGFLAVAAAMALPDAFAGFAPDGLAVGLPLAGFVLVVLAAALFPREGAEIDRRTPDFARDAVSEPSGLRRLPAEGGASPYGPETGATGL